MVNANQIRKIQYPDWLANIVMVKRTNNKWMICVDFIDLNTVFPKYLYPFPSIYTLVDNASVCNFLSLIDAFSGYNKIWMRPLDENKTTFMVEVANV